MLRTCSKHRWRNELLPQLRPACWQKSAVEAGTQRSQPTTHHSSAASLFLVPLNLFCPFPPPPSAAGGRSGDQAPAAASTEAAERGEAEQTPEQHRGHSGSGGDEIKGMQQLHASRARFLCMLLDEVTENQFRPTGLLNWNNNGTFSP